VSDILEKMRNAWNNLSPREQILLAVLGGGLVVSIFVFGLIMPFTQMSDSAEERVANAQRQIQVMQRLTREHSEIEGRLSGVEKRIQTQRGRQNIKTLLENLAQKSSVRIASMEERQAGKNDHYVETKVEVTLKGVSLSQTIKYLHNIEDSNQQLSVKGLRIKSRKSGAEGQLLDITFSVSSFQTT
jgi:type II secretory pathway component PulM